MIYPKSKRIAMTNAIYKLREAGATYADIAKQFGLNPSTPAKWLNDAGLYTPTYTIHKWTEEEDHLIALDVAAGATGQELCETVPGVSYGSILNRKNRLRRQGRIR